jgi:hypothetical protein
LGSAVIVILAFFAAAASRSLAQGDKPQLHRRENTPPEEKPPEKKKKTGKDPRAVGLLQLTSNGKATLIPIAILIDGKYYDASVYKADPVPMALDSGTVYEAEQAGESQGLFTINGVLRSKSLGSPNPWVATGSYLPRGTEGPKTTRKAEDVPVGLDDSAGDSGDGPPRLIRRDRAKPAEDSKPNSASPTPTASGSPEKPSTTAPAPSATGSSTGGSSGQTAAKPAAAPASDKPSDQSAKEQTPVAAAPAPQTTSGQASAEQSPTSQGSQAQASLGQTQGQSPENYYRPTLRRGKPSQSAPEDDETAPRLAKPSSPATAPAASVGPVQLVPAISDAGGPDPRPYKFFWKNGEEEERRNQMLALAADEVRAYAAALERNRILAKPPAKVAGHKALAKPAQPVFENLQFRAFDVWVTNQPVMILSAEAHFPPAPGATAAPDIYSITLVARTDIYGNLRKLYSGVTDKFHLDVTPRLELIDAVDVDGDGRGELLFRVIADVGSGYVIYRATADKLWKLFDNLNPQ